MSNDKSTLNTNASGKNLPAVWALASFALTTAVMAVILMICRIAPFGDGTLINEANAKWFESFTDMYRSVVSGEGVFYHLNVGFGSSFYHEFASGLCSPFLFLSLFFSQRTLASAFSVITLFRAGAAGAAACYMLRKTTSLEGVMCFALSLGYSLCGFTAFAAYYPSVADGAVFLPLLAVGIYHYVQASRPVRLFVFGALFFLTCPRLSALGLFLSFVLYAAFYSRKGSRRQRVYKSAMFAATLFCSAATSAVLVIPVWSGSVYYKNGVFSAIRTNDILSDLCFGGYGTSPAGGVGLCLAGLLVMGFFSFLFNTEICPGEKISVSTGAAAVILCHAVPPLAKYVLGFGNQDGEWINAGFMLALLGVYGTARSIALRRGIRGWAAVLSASLYLVLAVVSAVLTGGDVFALLAESGLAAFGCAVFVQLSVRGERPAVRLAAVTAAVLVLFGAVHCAGAVGRAESVISASRVSFIARSKAEARRRLEQSYRDTNEEVPRFYRTRSTDGVSDSVNLNLNAVDGLTEFAERLGIMRASQYGGADNFTEFTDILFGIALPNYGYYTKEELLRSVCSPAYLIDGWDGELPDGLNAFETQNYLADKWFGAALFEKAEPVETSSELSSQSDRYKWTFGNETTAVYKYTFETGDSRSLYVLAQGADYSYAVDGDSRSNWHAACAGGIYNLSQFRKSDDGTLTVYLSADVSAGEIAPVFMTAGEGLEPAVAPRKAEYISYRGSTIRFLFHNAVPQTAITSIPYENGWEITVNGRKVKPVEMCGGLIGIRLDKGTNSLVMTYTPPYFRTSLWISAAMLVFGLYITLKVEHEAARRRKVRMAFRAVELNISRMTVDQLGRSSGGEQEETQADGQETSLTEGKQTEQTTEPSDVETDDSEKGSDSDA